MLIKPLTVWLEIFYRWSFDNKISFFDDKQFEKTSIMIDECLCYTRWIYTFQSLFIKYYRHLKDNVNEVFIY